MRHKIAVFYYTQSGQALNIAKSVMTGVLRFAPDAFDIIYKEIKPTHEFPYPWNSREFFDAFPESRLGVPPCDIKPIDFSDVADASLVVVAGQSWFLSPSLPLQAFFLNTATKAYLHGRNVVFINGCRNMWLNTLYKVENYLHDAGASLVGHIVMQDKASNLVSVTTVIRWLFYGKQEKGWLLPRSGVTREDIEKASRYGEIIANNMKTGDYASLQDRLLTAGAIDHKPTVLFLERMGHRIFGLWALFIRHKGSFGDARRRFRCRLFSAYLVAVLYIISPFAQLIYWIIKGRKEKTVSRITVNHITA